MRSTIDGNSHSISTTRAEGLALKILRYLQFHRPEDRGQQVLIWVENEELFEGFNFEERIPNDRETLAAMKLLCNTVNNMWVSQNEGYTPFDDVNKLVLPDPNDIKLELMFEGHWDGEQFVKTGYAFQILTKRWVGLFSNSDGNGYLCAGQSHLPV